MDKICVPRLGAGRPRRLPDSAGADKAYSNGLIRSYLRRRGIRHVIPEKSDTKSARLGRGSRGGRPPGFDKTLQSQEHRPAGDQQARGVQSRRHPL